MNSEVQFLLRRRADVDMAAFHAQLHASVDRSQTAGAASEWVALMPADALTALPHVAETGGGGGADAIVTVSAPDDTLMRAIAAIVSNLRDAASLSDSTVAAGHRYSILPGRDRIRLFFGLRRLERLSRAEFLDYWLNLHAQLGRRLIPPYSYHQIHACAGLTDESARLTGVSPSPLDGIVEVHFPDLKALIAQLMRADVAAEALADERNFIDHARSAFHVYQSAPDPTIAGGM
jgi:hypothetical protein